jgi:beta-N-acetylhexosaminidase
MLNIFLTHLIIILAIPGIALQLDLTLEEKIGQLFIIPACQLLGEEHFEDLKNLIQEGKVGGILLKQGTAEGQRVLIDKLQRLSPIPLLCVQDGEFGLAMRLTDVLRFPKNLTLGAVQDLTLLYQLGQEIGRQCRLAGVHLNLAPVCDVNSNPQNPIIHMRSFGDDPFQVALRSKQVMCGIQSMGVLSCAKHFPGHGDTVVDSHVDLPVILHDWKRLQDVELLPFKCLIQAGVQVIMSAHLCVEALAEEAIPATFSQRMITDLLQKQLRFKGLIISDALNMQALSKYYPSDQIALKAVVAGHDLLLYGDHRAPNIDRILREDVPRAFAALKASVENGEISEILIDEKVAKILKAKEELNLFKGKLGVAENINSSEAIALKKKLFQEAITVVRNEDLIPLRDQRIALIEWGEAPVFVNRMNADRFSLNDSELFEKVREYSCLVVSLSKYSTVFPNFGLNPQDEALLTAVSKCGIPTIAVIFGTPYALSKLPSFEAIVVAYERENEAQEAAADILFGRLHPKGQLPIRIF